jgi:hypothetical protein
MASWFGWNIWRQNDVDILKGSCRYLIQTAPSPSTALQGDWASWSCGFRNSPLSIILRKGARCSFWGRATWSNSVGAPFILPPKHAAVFRKAAADFSEYADVVEDAGVDESVFERLRVWQIFLAHFE